MEDIFKATLTTLIKRAYENAKAKGFHDEDHLPGDPARNTVAKLTHLIRHISYKIEQVRKGASPPLTTYALGEELSKHVAMLDVENVESNEPFAATARRTAMLGLMHTEITEAADELMNGRTYFIQNGKPEGEAAELADVVIRVFDYAGAFNLDLAQAILDKMKYNEGREHMHGGKKL
jgi:NTP pyrophosphatase (non-canonical NTP hydrolase)